VGWQQLFRVNADYSFEHCRWRSHLGKSEDENLKDSCSCASDFGLCKYDLRRGCDSQFWPRNACLN
jgi:hypothetical protein